MLESEFVQLPGWRRYGLGGRSIVLGLTCILLCLALETCIDECAHVRCSPLSDDDVLQAATSRTGAQIGIPLLGNLQAVASADLIAVPADVAANLKHRVYPALVIAGGQIVQNHFAP